MVASRRRHMTDEREGVCNPLTVGAVLPDDHARVQLTDRDLAYWGCDCVLRSQTDPHGNAQGEVDRRYLARPHQHRQLVSGGGEGARGYRSSDAVRAWFQVDVIAAVRIRPGVPCHVVPRVAGGQQPGVAVCYVNSSHSGPG